MYVGVWFVVKQLGCLSNTNQILQWPVSKMKNLWLTSQPFLPNSDANRTAALTSWKIYSARLLVTGDEGVYPAGGDRTHISATPWDAADHFLPPYSLPPRLLESISHTAGHCVFSATLSQLQFTLVMVPLCSEVAELAAGVGTVNFCGFVLTVGRHETAIQESRNCWGPLRWKSACLSFKFIVSPSPKLLAHKQCCLLYYVVHVRNTYLCFYTCFSL